MTPKQKRFIDEYLIDFNASQAAARAGYKKSAAPDIGRQLLRKTPIALELARRQEKTHERAVVTRDQVLRELAAVGMSDVRKLFDAHGQMKPLHELDDATAASIAGIESLEEFEGRGENRKAVGIVRKIKRFDKNKALELLGRHLGLWADTSTPPNIGPGLTVIIQQGAQGTQAVVASNRVEISLPAPT